MKVKLAPEWIAMGVVGLLSAWDLTPFAMPHKLHEIVLCVVLLALVLYQVRSAYLTRETKWSGWTMVYAAVMLTLLVCGLTYQIRT